MKNVWLVFKRDVLRLLKAPAALVVVVALVVLPSLYTWFNVAGFWDPYSNTGNLRVCVVNEDKGASSEITGDLDLGSQIVAELESNDQLGWEFTDRVSAMDEVQSGKAYAAIVIPSDFSYDMTTLFTGSFQQPKLEYYVNEKAGAVSPKITDAGATTLDETVNSTFVKTVSSVVTQRFNEGMAEAKSSLDASQASVSLRLQEAQDQIGSVRTQIASLGEVSSSAAQKAKDAKVQLAQAKEDVDLMASQLSEVSQLTTSTQNALRPFTSSLLGTMDKSSILASQVATNANTSIGQAAAAVTGSQASVAAALESAKAATEQNASVIAQLESVIATMPDSNPAKESLSQAVATAKAQNDALAQSVAGLEQVNTQASQAATDIAAASNNVNDAVQGTLNNASDYRQTLSSSTLPAIDGGLSQMAAATARLSTAVSNQKLLIDQSIGVMDQLVQVLDSTGNALSETDKLMATLEAELATIQTDVLALGSSGVLADYFKNGELDAGKIAEFMGSPTELRTEMLYPVNAYGSAMAPLFMNLTLWIGVFMLLVILKQEVDSAGIRNLTAAQSFIARWLLLMPLVILQALVCCTGVLVLGVQVASVGLFMLTSVLASLTYLCIQYTLSVLLQHIGKGICIVLVFAQIPGATGLYPIEMTPAFFQAVYPALPFTYGINALRETIAGFYGQTWFMLVGVLLLFAVAFFAAGALARPYFTNLNRMFAKQIKESDIFNGEDVQLPARRYKVDQLVAYLSDSPEYRDGMRNRAQRFMQWYPRLKRGAWVLGAAVPVLAAVALTLTEGEKVVLLTVWLVWLIATLVFLVALEHVRNNVERQFGLEEMSEGELRTLLGERSLGVSEAKGARDE